MREGGGAQGITTERLTAMERLTKILLWLKIQVLLRCSCRNVSVSADSVRP